MKAIQLQPGERQIQLVEKTVNDIAELGDQVVQRIVQLDDQLVDGVC